MTKFNFVSFVFPSNDFLKVLRAFQVFGGHFQCLWENKVKQSKLCPLFRKQRQSDTPIFDYRLKAES
jgi:hypothetical protein